MINVNSNLPIWQSIGDEWPRRLPINCIQHYTAGGQDIIFAGTDYGLYFTPDDGANWYKDRRIPNVAIFTLQCDFESNALFVFTYGRGIWGLKFK